MNILVHQPKVGAEPGRHLLLRQIGREAYEKIVEALAEAHVRTTYDRGTSRTILIRRGRAAGGRRAGDSDENPAANP